MPDSLITKRLLSRTLKELAKHRNLDKISINDLTLNCNLNRQTFYYHFKDKYDLLQWLYYDELFEEVEKKITFNNWEECLIIVLKKIYTEKEFYINTINSNEQYFYQNLYNICQKCFFEVISKLDHQNKIPHQEKIFFSQFYTYGVSGIILQWIKSDMKKPPEKLVCDLKNIATQSKTFIAKLLIF